MTYSAMEAWRPLLYYPLGLLPLIFFALRVLVQWIASEKKGFSIVPPLFWKLSLGGNLLLILHFLIQVQYPFCLLQAINAVISWRNLNLFSSSPCSTKKTLMVFLSAFLLITGLFLAQSYYLIGEIDWIRTPTKLFDATREYHALGWHCLGVMGGTLFASRFWLQWWRAERYFRSELPLSFWWISIMGSLLSLVYFIKIQDVVNILNYGLALIPYLRNLVLIKKKFQRV